MINNETSFIEVHLHASVFIRSDESKYRYVRIYIYNDVKSYYYCYYLYCTFLYKSRLSYFCQYIFSPLQTRPFIISYYFGQTIGNLYIYNTIFILCGNLNVFPPSKRNLRLSYSPEFIIGRYTI